MMNLGLGDSGSNNKLDQMDKTSQKISEILKGDNIILTGIGARDTPSDILNLMTRIAYEFEKRGAILRSGGAGGADLAFEKGFNNPSNCQIFHPWNGFKPGRNMSNDDVNKIIDRVRPYSGPGSAIVLNGTKLAEAEKIAAQFHPAWDRCSQGARKLHTRNVPQILGEDLNQKSSLVICWTADGGASGGTGQAMRMAKSFGISIVNLKLEHDKNLIINALNIN